MRKTSIAIFIEHSKIYIYIFLFLILALIVNNIMSEKELHNKILNSKPYEEQITYNTNHLLHLTDIIKVKGVISDEDNIFNLSNTVVLRKKVEMYSWVRRFIKSHTTYKKSWEIKYREKPSMLIRTYDNPLPEKKLGVFYYYPNSIYLRNIQIPTKNFKADKYQKVKLKDSRLDRESEIYYKYYGNSDLNNPQIGDIRIRYDIYRANQKTTVFLTYDNEKIFDSNFLKSIYKKDLFLTFFKGDINSVYNSFLDNESKWKFLLRLLLSSLLFIPIFKISIIIFNMNLKKEISSIKIKAIVIFLIIIPISLLLTYLTVEFVNFFF